MVHNFNKIVHKVVLPVAYTFTLLRKLPPNSLQTGVLSFLPRRSQRAMSIPDIASMYVPRCPKSREKA